MSKLIFKSFFVMTLAVSSALAVSAETAPVKITAQPQTAEQAKATPQYPLVSTDLVRNSAAKARKDAAGSVGTSVNEASSILMRPGVNAMIPIAMFHPNRIVTPFKHPQVISTTLSGGSKPEDCGEVCVRGNVVYISTDKTYPVTAFITEKGNDSLALSLTMIPKRIPPREVELRVPEEVQERIAVGSGVVGSNDEAEAWETSMPYVETIRQSFHLIAKGEVPPGYTLRKTRASDAVPACRQPGLAFDFKNGQVLLGSKLNVFVGVAENIGHSPVEFREQHCGHWNVTAVAAWPLKVLRPGQKTEVFVAMREDEKPAPGSVRKPLIDRQYN